MATTASRGQPRRFALKTLDRMSHLVESISGRAPAALSVRPKAFQIQTANVMTGEVFCSEIALRFGFRANTETAALCNLCLQAWTDQPSSLHSLRRLGERWHIPSQPIERVPLGTFHGLCSLCLRCRSSWLAELAAVARSYAAPGKRQREITPERH